MHYGSVSQATQTTVKIAPNELGSISGLQQIEPHRQHRISREPTRQHGAAWLTDHTVSMLEES